MRVDLSLDLPEPGTLRECAEQLTQLRAAATILSHQTARRPDADAVCAPLFERISALEVMAADLPIASAADAAAGLEVLRDMIEPDGWQYTDRRDARLFDAIRDGVGGLGRAGRVRSVRDALNTSDFSR